MKRAAPSLSSLCAAAIAHGMVGITILFMFLPPAVIVALSFSGEDHLSFPPASWGLRQYSALIASDYWLGAIWTSLKIAGPVALVATAIALSAGLAIHRSRLPGRQALSFAGILPLIVPVSAYAVSLYGLFAKLDLIATYGGIILAHVILAVPLSLILLDSTLTALAPELELVAMTLGASRRQAWASITLRLLMPALGASLIFAFLASFDEAVLINFLGGGIFTTLPKAIFDAVRFGVDPLIAAIAALLILITSILAGVTVAIQYRSKG